MKYYAISFIIKKTFKKNKKKKSKIIKKSL